MSDKLIFSIDGASVDIGSVWVHFQGTNRPEIVVYEWVVPQPQINSVFDPHANRPSATSISEFVTEQVADLGTFIVDGYLKNARRLLGVQRLPFKWVIATVDDVIHSERGLVLRGKALPFIM